MPAQTDEFGGVAVAPDVTDEFGGVAVASPEHDEFGGIAVAPTVDATPAWRAQPEPGWTPTLEQSALDNRLYDVMMHGAGATVGVQPWQPPDNSATLLAKRAWDAANALPRAAAGALRVTPQQAQDALDVLAAGQSGPGQGFAPEVPREKAAVESVSEPGTAAKTISGLTGAVNEASTSALNPVMAALLVGGGLLPKMAQRVVSLGFAGQMAASLPAQYEAAKEAVKNGDAEDIAHALGTMALTGTFTGMALKHGFSPAPLGLAGTVGKVLEKAANNPKAIEAFNQAAKAQALDQLRPENAQERVADVQPMANLESRNVAEDLPQPTMGEGVSPMPGSISPIEPPLPVTEVATEPPAPIISESPATEAPTPMAEPTPEQPQASRAEVVTTVESPKATGVSSPSPQSLQLGIVASMPLTRSVMAGFAPNISGYAAAGFRKIAQKSMPMTTSVDRDVGEAGVRFASAQTAGHYMARSLVQDVLGGLGIDRIKFGTALTEDNLRSIRDKFIAAGEDDKANAVRTLIGAKGSPFRTEKAYQDFLTEPNTQIAITRHIDAWKNIIDPMYIEAARLDPNVTLVSRGQQTGARISLYRVEPGDLQPRSMSSGVPTSTMARTSRFSRQATGASDHYGIDYQDMMAHRIGSDYEAASKNIYEKKLIEGGHAVVADSANAPREIQGEPTVAFDHKSSVGYVNKDTGETFYKAPQKLYIRKSMAGDYANATRKQGPILSSGFMRGVADVGNTASLLGLIEPVTHLRNLMTVMFTTPSVGIRNPILDLVTSAAAMPANMSVALLRTLAKTAGVALADLAQNPSMAGALTRQILFPKIVRAALERAYGDHSRQLADIAQIGAGRLPHEAFARFGAKTSAGFMSSVIQYADSATRMIMDDTFKYLARDGVVEDTQTNRRDFINQIGQYNKKLQPVLMRALRESGVSPFITAGLTYNSLGVRRLFTDPGVKGLGAGNKAMLHATVLAKAIGTFSTIGITNYLLTHNKGGGVLGRPGVPIGAIDTGKDDVNGNPIYYDALALVGFGRGLRATGIRGFAQSKLLGLDNQTSADAAMRDMANAWMNPAAGPLVRFGVSAATGYMPALDLPREFPKVAQGSQHASDLMNAFYNLTPATQIARDMKRFSWLPYTDQSPPSTPSDVLWKQIGSFGERSGKPSALIDRYPEAIAAARANSYMDDVINRARSTQQRGRPMSIDEKVTYYSKSISQLPVTEQKRAWKEVERREHWKLNIK